MKSLRPAASLRPTLLARKGTARPAMRSGAPNDLDSLAQAQEALGWNEMGYQASAPAATVEPSLPIAAECARRAAFTLRLDSERHLKLRLASAVSKRSAQVLVTEALDQFLGTISHIDALVLQAGKSPSGSL